MTHATKLKQKDVVQFLPAAAQLVKLPKRRMWIDYDDGADVLYFSFRKPQRATNSRMRDDGIVVHCRGKEIVGLTILDASER